MSVHEWIYVSDSAFGTTEEMGPVAETELLALIRLGRLKRETPVSSPSRTKGAYYQLQQIPALLKAFEQFEQEKKTEQQRKNQELMVIAQQEEHRHSQEMQRILSISDCQDLTAVLDIEAKLRPLLTQHEAIQYLAIQRKFLWVNLVPDAVVATNRRLIFYKPKLFGAYDFHDYLWIDLHNAHFRQGYFGATFWARHTSGLLLQMDWLPRVAVQKLYRLAQDREEQARWARRDLDLEMRKAGAMQVNVQTNNQFVQPPTQIIDAQAVPRRIGN